jgi:hypothetical protein
MQVAVVEYSVLHIYRETDSEAGWKMSDILEGAVGNRPAFCEIRILSE